MIMKKIILALALLLASVSLATAAPLLVTDSGVSAGSANNTIGERKSSWDASQTDEWIVAWVKIPPGSDQENGTTRYTYRITYTSPDKSGVVNEGPFNFPSNGIALTSKQVSFFDNIKTGFSPKPNEGEWKIEFTLIDKGNNNKEDLAALLPFYLTGSDTAQKPTEINEAKDKAVGETVDMSMLAVFNTAKQFGAQQEQARQAATTTTTTTLANPAAGISKAATPEAKKIKTKAKIKPKKK
jgi:hypothetical protein